MTGYTKLFNSILGSTIWREDPATKVVWITLLALADRDGIAEASIPGLASFASVSTGEAEAAVEKFLSPDPYSRSPEHEGRRIEAVDGGWRILNHDKYRFKMSKDDIRERDRVRKQRQRDRQKCPTECGTKCDTSEISEKSNIQKAEADPETEEARAKNARSAPALPDWIPLEAWTGFVEMRSRIRKPLTKRAIDLLVERLDDLRKQGHDVRKLLDRSVRNSWQDIYPDEKGTAVKRNAGKQPSVAAMNQELAKECGK